MGNVQKFSLAPGLSQNQPNHSPDLCPCTCHLNKIPNTLKYSELCALSKDVLFSMQNHPISRNLDSYGCIFCRDIPGVIPGSGVLLQ